MRKLHFPITKEEGEEKTCEIYSTKRTPMKMKRKEKEKEKLVSYFIWFSFYYNNVCKSVQKASGSLQLYTVI